jgi:hypothetical protein
MHRHAWRSLGHGDEQKPIEPRHSEQNYQKYITAKCNQSCTVELSAPVQEELPILIEIGNVMVDVC